MTDRSCSVLEDGTPCDGRAIARGWCDKHYRRWRKHGDPLAGPRAIVYADAKERFLAKVDRRGDDECWPWLSRTLPGGYGIFYLKGEWLYAHRVAYEFFAGPIPEGLTIDHVRANGCTRRDCVNWLTHLEPVTQKENNLRSDSRSARQARQTHCIRGHEFTDENTYRHRGHRYCKQCRKDRRRG